MEYAGSPFEIKELTDSGAIEGMLAGFGNVDFGGDKLMPGCLSKSLAARTSPLPMLLCHDLKRPIGAWKSWDDRPEGIYVKGNLTLATRDGAEAYALAKDGALTALSIGWKPEKAGRDSKGVRNVEEAQLFEGSLVPVGMNPSTRITSVKAIMGPRDIEELLQESGMSGRKAKHAASAAWKAINEQSDDEAELAELAAIIGNSTARLSTIGVK